MTTLKESLCPPETQDKMTEWMLSEDGGFLLAKRLEDGTYAGVVQLFATYAICMGVDRTGMQKRFCFEPPLTQCLWAFKHLKTLEDDPTGWVSSRPKPEQEHCAPIATAPTDGTYVRAFHFDQFGFIKWCRTAAYQDGWVEVDSSRDGEPINPTHWKPE